MSGTLRLRTDFDRLKDLQADLEAVQIGLGRQVASAKSEASGIIAGRARRLTPVGPGPIAGAKHPDDRLPHIRDTIRGTARGVVTTHPGGLVHEWGGTIRPRGAPIQIRRSAMTQKGAAREQARVERLLDRRVDELLDRHL